MFTLKLLSYLKYRKPVKTRPISTREVPLYLLIERKKKRERDKQRSKEIHREKGRNEDTEKWRAK